MALLVGILAHTMFSILFTRLHLLHNKESTVSTSASMLHWCTVPARLCAWLKGPVRGGWHHSSSHLSHSASLIVVLRAQAKKKRRARTQHTSSSYVLLPPLLPSPCVSVDRYAAVGGATEVWINLTTARSNCGRVREREWELECGRKKKGKKNWILTNGGKEWPTKAEGLEFQLNIYLNLKYIVTLIPHVGPNKARIW